MSQINGRSSSRPPARQCVAKCLLKVWQADDSLCPDKLVVSPLGPCLPPYSALCPACIRTGAPLQPPLLFLSSYPAPGTCPGSSNPHCLSQQGLWSTAISCADSIFLVYRGVEKFGTYSLQDKAHAHECLQWLLVSSPPPGCIDFQNCSRRVSVS